MKGSRKRERSVSAKVSTKPHQDQAASDPAITITERVNRFKMDMPLHRIGEWGIGWALLIPFDEFRHLFVDQFLTHALVNHRVFLVESMTADDLHIAHIITD